MPAGLSPALLPFDRLKVLSNVEALNSSVKKARAFPLVKFTSRQSGQAVQMEQTFRYFDYAQRAYSLPINTERITTKILLMRIFLGSPCCFLATRRCQESEQEIRTSAERSVEAVSRRPQVRSLASQRVVGRDGFQSLLLYCSTVTCSMKKPLAFSFRRAR